MEKYWKFVGKIRWKFSEIFRKNMKISGQIFRLTSVMNGISLHVSLAIFIKHQLHALFRIFRGFLDTLTEDD